MEPPIPYEENKPWGKFIEFTHEKLCTVKILTINSEEAFSLQHHEKRDEFWYIISGNGTIKIGGDRSPIVVGGNYFIKKGINHRIEAGSAPVIVLEISFGEFDEGDIVRLKDKYGRTDL